MTETKSKLRKLMALLSRAGIDDDTRHDLVYGWTGGRTRSTRDLTSREIDDLVWKFENDYNFRQDPSITADALLTLEIKRKRSIVLAIAQRCGLHSGTDFNRFNSFMENRSVLKKRLNKYSIDELDELIRQMHKLEENYKASSEKAFSKAWHQHYGIPYINEN